MSSASGTVNCGLVCREPMRCRTGGDRHERVSLGGGGWWMPGPAVWDCSGMDRGDGSRDRYDFFLSYTQADRAWAEWIAWLLEEDGHRVLVQAWDFVPGSNWIQGMQGGTRDAARTIAVLSPDYLESVYGSAEWQAAWAQDPAGTGRKLLVVRVKDCGRPGLLAGGVGGDVFGGGAAGGRGGRGGGVRDRGGRRAGGAAAHDR